MNTCNTRAVVLLSGGIDSTTVLAIAAMEADECTALTFSYGQKHILELKAAKAAAASMKVKRHLIVPLPIGKHIVSALTDVSLEVPKSSDRCPKTSEIPSTYVPARNTIFLSYALAVAETIEADRIYTGVSAVDYSGYPDCRPEFIKAFQELADLATKKSVEGGRIRIMAPLLHLSKADTIKKGHDLGVDYSNTLSCYNPSEAGQACGECDSCHLRLRGFAEAGFKDPVSYSTRKR